MRPPDPEVLAAARQEFLSRPGVLSVSWGFAWRKGRWDRRRLVLAVRVVEKLQDPEHPIPRRFRGWATDIVAVGAAVASALSAGDWAGRDSDPTRAGVVTALALTDGKVVALLSGHAALPLENGRIVEKLEGCGPVFVGSALGTAEGRCVGGALTEDEDWALAELAGDATGGHPGAPDNSVAPWPVLSPTVGTKVRHWSTVQGGVSRGGVVAGADGIPVELPDGRTLRYANLLEVSRPGRRFAKQGDSGSLVFADTPTGQAVGVVVAVLDEPPFLAFVRPASAFSAVVPGGDAFFV